MFSRRLPNVASLYCLSRGDRKRDASTVTVAWPKGPWKQVKVALMITLKYDCTSRILKFPADMNS